MKTPRQKTNPFSYIIISENGFTKCNRCNILVSSKIYILIFSLIIISENKFLTCIHTISPAKYLHQMLRGNIRLLGYLLTSCCYHIWYDHPSESSSFSACPLQRPTSLWRDFGATGRTNASAIPQGRPHTPTQWKTSLGIPERIEGSLRVRSFYPTPQHVGGT